MTTHIDGIAQRGPFTPVTDTRATPAAAVLIDGIAQNPTHTPPDIFPSRAPATVTIDNGAGGFTIINAADFDASTMTAYRAKP